MLSFAAGVSNGLSVERLLSSFIASVTLPDWLLAAERKAAEEAGACQ
jgi:hypothetical protein